MAMERLKQLWKVRNTEHDPHSYRNATVEEDIAAIEDDLRRARERHQPRNARYHEWCVYCGNRWPCPPRVRIDEALGEQ